MYKLVVVAGKLRGQEYELESGENTLGRSDECNVHFPVEGVSKKHLSITVTGEVAFIKDLDSANGTFVNGKIVKRTTVKNGDKITLPDTIIQIVEVKEKKKIIKKRIKSEDEEEDFMSGGEMPESLAAKLIWLFKYRFMQVIHGINNEYEWKFLFAILLVIFIVVNVTLTIFPVLTTSKNLLLVEVAKRGQHYAEEIKRLNRKSLAIKDLDRVDTSFLENTGTGIISYDLFDVSGRIVRPLSRLNQYVDDTFSVRVRQWAEGNPKNIDNGVTMRLDDGEIGIGQAIKATSLKTGESEIVGVIAIRFRPSSLAEEATKSQVAYFEALITSFIAAIIFFAIIYYLTLRPIEEMKYQIEETLRGKRKKLESQFLWAEVDPLRSSINTLIQRFRELQKDGLEDDFTELEPDDTYVANLYEFMQGAQGAALVLNSEKNLSHINSMAEDLTGIRESSSVGMSLLDVAREKGFAATVMDLCDRSGENGGTSQQGEYELAGKQYNIFCVSLMGKDNFPKSFYVTFVQDE